MSSTHYRHQILHYTTQVLYNDPPSFFTLSLHLSFVPFCTPPVISLFIDDDDTDVEDYYYYFLPPNLGVPLPEQH